MLGGLILASLSTCPRLCFRLTFEGESGQLCKYLYACLAENNTVFFWLWSQGDKVVIWVLHTQLNIHRKGTLSLHKCTHAWRRRCSVDILSCCKPWHLFVIHSSQFKKTATCLNEHSSTYLTLLSCFLPF